jgi:hypothetical protein
MAHHMLHTALQENPCYDGYLWAPFDTLLNVPRLQLFDQNKFWYHSPFGRYIPNPALDRSAARYPSYHAPAANISPDPANMTTPWKGWSEDWWYATSHSPLPPSLYSPRRVFLIKNRWGYVHFRSLYSRLLEFLFFICCFDKPADRLMSGCPFACKRITGSPKHSAIV